MMKFWHGGGLIQPVRIALFFLVIVTAVAAAPGTVPPTLEIEVIDPNAGPLGRPAVELGRDELGNLIVDIPPTLLVHRYYYTGDRSFQAQLLPGGPTIVVLSHPKTGERTYIDVQMPPGAPRVTYSSHYVKYDFGQTAVTVEFGLFGYVGVKYRNGRALGAIFRVDGLKQRVHAAHEHLRKSAGQTKAIAYGAVATVSETADQVALPARNLLETLPFGKIVFAPDMAQQLAQTAAEHERDKANRRAKRDRRFDELSLRTIR